MQGGVGMKNVFIRPSARSMSKKRHDLEAYKQDLHIDDHLVTIPELEKRFSTNLETGLTTTRAKQLYTLNGPNIIKPFKSKTKCQILTYHMFYNYAALLWIGIVLSLTGFTISYLRSPEDTRYDQVYLAVILFVVIMVTGYYGFYQESQHSRIAKTFQNLMPKFAYVIRDGELLQINTEQLVLGDLVRLQAGDCVPADIRITQTSGLKVDNSSLTGESDPQLRTTEMTDVNPLETMNLAFYGTNVVEGSGSGIIIACGDDTCMGHIAALTAGLEMAQSPIQKDLARFIRIITAIAFVIGVSFFIVCMCLECPFFEAFLFFIAIVVTAIPEGLLVTWTAALTLTARKMFKKNCLCKNLNAIENLGCISVLCSDKTGTLTQNKMTVSHLYYDDISIDVTADTFKPVINQGFFNLCLVAILCSRAKFEEGQQSFPVKSRAISGDASESAVLKCMEIITGRQTSVIRKEHPKIFEIPFNSTNKYQLSIHTIPNDTRLYLVMKGAPENVIESCSWITLNETVEELTESNKRKLKVTLIELSYMGERVLGFADLLLPPEYEADYEFNLDRVNFPIEGLRFVGFISMLDPPRAGVKQAVAKCKNAGIKVIMVTGDHPITAMAIAKKVGIISPENDTVYDLVMRRNISSSKVTEAMVAQCGAAVITGNDLWDMDQEELDDIITSYDEIVFARTSPQQKLQILEAFQRAGYVVGVTGDGTNDSPALKKADIGIAMGTAGSDVAKEAADIIIIDDNFASIVISIEEGRLIYDNIKKAIFYLLTSKCPELVPFLLHVVVNIPLCISIISIIIIDVGTDLWPSISLVYERPEADIMYRPPREVNTDRLVTMRMIYYANLIIGVIQTFAGLSCWFFVMAEYGFLPNRLCGIREEWNSSKNDLLDSYNLEWSMKEREQLIMKGYSAYFLGVVVTQVAVCIIAKTRRRSILQQGMENTVMNFGLLFELGLALALVYCPYVNDFFDFSPVQIYILAPAIPFALSIVFLDEFRKALIRWRPGGWFERETYF